MDAVVSHDSTRATVTVVAVMYGRRVKVRFPSDAEIVVPASMLEAGLSPEDAASLEEHFAVDGPGWMTALQFGVLDHLVDAGAKGLLDSQYPWPRGQVALARRVLRHRGLVGPADAKTGSDDDGRLVRWRVAAGGLLEHKLMSRLERPIGVAGEHRLVQAGAG